MTELLSYCCPDTNLDRERPNTCKSAEGSIAGLARWWQGGADKSIYKEEGRAECRRWMYSLGHKSDSATTTAIVSCQ